MWKKQIRKAEKLREDISENRLTEQKKRVILLTQTKGFDC